MQQLLTAALDAAIFALVGITFLAYLRRRTPIGRDTVLLFSSVGLVLLLPIVTAAGRQLGYQEDLPPVVWTVFTVVFIAQPFLTIRLIQHFRERMGGVVLASFLLFVASAAAFLYTTFVSSPATGEPIPAWLTLGIVAYFAGINILAAAYFLDEARRRAGAARIRLALAAAGSILFGVGILILGADTVASPPNSLGQAREPNLVAIFAELLILLAGLADLLAFVPPRFLREFWQRAVAYGYLRDLVMDPEGDEQHVLWHRLAMAARLVTGVRSACVAVGSYEQGAEIAAADGDWRNGSPIGQRIDGPDLRGIGAFNAAGRRLDKTGPTVRPLLESSGARRVGSIPIATDTGTQGILLLFMARTSLFVEDDLMLLDVLNAHTARAVERHKVLAERTALVSQLRQANDQLAHVSAAKSDFLAAMSHELRTPLHAIIGFSELLLTPATETGGNGVGHPSTGDPSIGESAAHTNGVADPNVREFAGHIHGAGLHLLELINDVLDLARVEAGRLDLVFQSFDISALVFRTAKTMRPIAARKRVSMDIPEPLGIEIEADAARVRQIIFNLLSNAIKFTPAGGHVDVLLESTGDEVRLTIADSGPGIAAEDQQRIFEPFEQSWRRETPRLEGTGLGLALTRQLVEGHDGRIQLDSELGRGSRFTVILPRVIRAPVPAEEKRPTASIVAPATDRASNSQVVLVVEDDPRAQELLAIYVREAGYTVAVASDGVLALSEAHRLLPAAVILDVMLPGLDGWEVLRELKARPETVGIPVIICSVVDESEVGFALGAIDYLVKPVRREVLIRELRRLAAMDGEPVDNMTVLAIDDDQDALDLYRAELEPDGFVVLTAQDGESGLRIAREHHPAAVLLDLLMPEMDGFAVAAALLHDPATHDIPIMVLTSHDVTPEEKKLLDGNVHQVLRKGPEATAGLLRWLQRATGRAGAAAPAPRRATDDDHGRGSAPSAVPEPAAVSAALPASPFGEDG